MMVTHTSLFTGFVESMRMMLITASDPLVINCVSDIHSTSRQQLPSIHDEYRGQRGFCV